MNALKNRSRRGGGDNQGLSALSLGNSTQGDEVRPLHGGFEVESIFMRRRASWKSLVLWKDLFVEWRLLSLILLSACGRERRASRRDREKDQIQVAALALPGGPQADWQQWDSFLTNVVNS